MRLKLVFAFLCMLLSGCDFNKLYTDNRTVMGTFVETTSPDKRAAQIVFDELTRLENILSAYNPESEVSRLNAHGSIVASPELFTVIKRSLDISRRTDGAFDITVGPLADLWGFTTQSFAVPPKNEIARALNLVGGPDKIVLNENNNVVEFIIPGMKIDLGGIGKGFALDCAVRKLRANGINRCLINLGGQVYALGSKTQSLSWNPLNPIVKSPWQVAVKDPRETGSVAKYLDVSDQSVSTSGDYEQFFFWDNKRYSHIIDPHSGYPADSGTISVTVIAPDGTTADALSTAIFVMGEGNWKKISRSKFKHVKVHFIR